MKLTKINSKNIYRENFMFWKGNKQVQIRSMKLDGGNMETLND